MPKENVAMLNLVSRIAFRAAGDVEPNPMVGCVLVRDGIVLGMGHHRRYGDLHAEREALVDCQRRGNDPRGSTVFVTLEPCCHHGKQPPCTDALIQAGVARVVFARKDPHILSSGGEKTLKNAGISCELCADSPLATHISDPFVKRVQTGLPWVIAKWAQTAQGSMTTPEGESPWITNAMSLRRVHRLRSRVDTIITGIGTVLADDPLLTARGIPRVRRHAIRVVLDSHHRIDPSCKLLQSASAMDRVIVISGHAHGLESSSLNHCDQPGIEYLSVPIRNSRLDLRVVLEVLAQECAVTNVMLECGPQLMQSFLADELVDEAFVYIAANTETDSYKLAFTEALGKFERVRTKPLAGDTELWFRRRCEA